VTAAVLSRAPGDAAWANADGGVIAPTIPIVAVGAIPPDLNIDALLSTTAAAATARRGATTRTVPFLARLL